MNAQPLIQNHGQNDKSFITVFPESKDPFKNPENDRVKALRFSAFTAPEGPSTLALPYCPRPPTLWRPSTEEDDSETKLFNSRSPLRKVALSSSSLKRRQVCSAFRRTKLSDVTQSCQKDPHSDLLNRPRARCHTCSVCLSRGSKP